MTHSIKSALIFEMSTDILYRQDFLRIRSTTLKFNDATLGAGRNSLRHDDIYPKSVLLVKVMMAQYVHKRVLVLY